MKNKSLVLTVTLNLLGTIIGAGVFGLPAVFSEMGILGGSLLYLLVLVVAIVLHMLYLDVVLSVKAKHRLPGYSGLYLGKSYYWLSFFSLFFKISGTILAYIILGGTFLYGLLNSVIGGTEFFWSVVFWLVGSMVVVFGLGLVAHIEDEMTGILIGFLIFTAVILFPFFNWNDILVINYNSLFNVLGIMFFSVMGVSVLPDIVSIAGVKRSQARLGVFLGVFLAGFLSWIFGTSIALVYPHVKTVEDIRLAFPSIFWWLIPLIGLLSVGTSFLTMMQALKNMILIDLKLKLYWSWSLAIFLPFLLYIFISRNFLSTIGFIGAVFTAFNGLMIALMAWKVMNKKQRSVFWLRKLINPKTKNKSVPIFWKMVTVFTMLVLIFIIIQKVFITIY